MGVAEVVVQVGGLLAGLQHGVVVLDGGGVVGFGVGVVALLHELLRGLGCGRYGHGEEDEDEYLFHVGGLVGC